LSCLYDVLGVSKNASGDEIKHAYRELAMKYHPDRNPDGEDKFKEVSAAYEILRDEEKKKNYDQFGSVDGGGGSKPFESMFNDVFSSFFGGGSGRRDGEDIIVREFLTLEEAFSGVKKKLRYMRKEVCANCNGIGGEKGTCQNCNGSGFRVLRGGHMNVRMGCQSCDGTGKTISNACKKCGGQRFSGNQEKLFDFDFPKGVEDGMQFRVVDAGNPSLDGGSNGDLYVTVGVKDHDLFLRDNYGILLCVVPVTYSQLVLGCNMNVPTIEGKVTFTIPSGTQPGTKFRLSGKGMPIIHSNRRGDQLVQVKLEIPRKLGEDYRRKVQEMSELEAENITPMIAKFKKKVGEYDGKS